MQSESHLALKSKQNENKVEIFLQYEHIKLDK